MVKPMALDRHNSQRNPTIVKLNPAFPHLDIRDHRFNLRAVRNLDAYLVYLQPFRCEEFLNQI